MIDSLRIAPAPGHAYVSDSGRVSFTPPETLPPRTLAVAGDFTVEPDPSGVFVLRSADGYGWGRFASEELAEQTAERLSR